MAGTLKDTDETTHPYPAGILILLMQATWELTDMQQS